ncbi:hypothetical protein [Streptomyces sp. NPDC048603]|uniref:effector-associated constant component EACC1 n=1 Tax=Streptomyces sp. NPDC048603 TaxID=3365577 RepID=UPI00371E778B
MNPVTAESISWTTGVRMEVEILSAGQGDDDELRALRAWLRADPQLRGTVIRLVESEEPETMGGLLEAVHVIISDGSAVGGFAVSLATWLGSRPRARSRRVRVDGRERELPGRADADRVGALLEPGPADREPAPEEERR